MPAIEPPLRPLDALLLLLSPLPLVVLLLVDPLSPLSLPLVTDALWALPLPMPGSPEKLVAGTSKPLPSSSTSTCNHRVVETTLGRQARAAVGTSKQTQCVQAT